MVGITGEIKAAFSSFSGVLSVGIAKAYDLIKYLTKIKYIVTI